MADKRVTIPWDVVFSEIRLEISRGRDEIAARRLVAKRNGIPSAKMRTQVHREKQKPGGGRLNQGLAPVHALPTTDKPTPEVVTRRRKARTPEERARKLKEASEQWNRTKQAAKQREDLDQARVLTDVLGVRQLMAITKHLGDRLEFGTSCPECWKQNGGEGGFIYDPKDMLSTVKTLEIMAGKMKAIRQLGLDVVKPLQPKEETPATPEEWESPEGQAYLSKQLQALPVSGLALVGVRRLRAALAIAEQRAS